MPDLNDFNALIGNTLNEGVHVGYVTNRYTREQAVARLIDNGLSASDANALLDQPITDPAVIDKWATGN